MYTALMYGLKLADGLTNPEWIPENKNEEELFGKTREFPEYASVVTLNNLLKKLDDSCNIMEDSCRLVAQMRHITEEQEKQVANNIAQCLQTYLNEWLQFGMEEDYVKAFFKAEIEKQGLRLLTLSGLTSEG